MNLTPIYIDQNQAQQFIAGPQQLENKVVLKVDEQSLRFVRLADTSFSEVVQAEFGYGPLSLASIVDFISKNAEAVTAALEVSDVSKKEFLTKIRDCSFSHNSKYLNRKVDSFALEIILKDLIFDFSLVPLKILNTFIEIIEPRAPKDMARVTQAKICKNGRKFLNIALVSKCFNTLVSEKLGVIRTVGLLMNKYFVLNRDDETYINTKYDTMAHPQLLDAVCTQHHLQYTSSTFNTYDKSIEDDIRQIVTLTPQSINCITGLRSIEKAPVLLVACINRNIPISIIEFLLENGANPDQEILINTDEHETILAILKHNKNMPESRVEALEELFQKYTNKNPIQVEEIKSI